MDSPLCMPWRRGLIRSLALLLAVAIQGIRAEEIAPHFRWATPVGVQVIGGIDVDELGQVYLTGISYGSDVAVGTNTIPHVSMGWMVVAKCDRSGNLVWGLQDGAQVAFGAGIAVDSNRNVYVLCDLGSAGQQGAWLAGTSVTGRLALAKYNSDGHGLHGTALGHLSSGGLTPISLTVAPSGVSYWTADLQGDVSIANTNFSAGDGSLLAKCNSEGDVVWAKLLGAGSYPAGTMSFFGPAVDSSENVYIAGGVREPTDFDGATNLLPIGGADMFAAKFSSDGNLLWLQQGGGIGFDSAHSIAVDRSGNCFVGVSFFQSASFGHFSFNNDVATQYLGVVKYDPSGNVLWARQVGQGIRSIVAADAEGNCYVAGERNVYLDEGGSCAKYDANGSLMWIRSIPPIGVDWLKADAAGACYLSASMGHGELTNVDLDGIPLNAPSSSYTHYILRLDTTTLPRLDLRPNGDAATVSWSALFDDFFVESSPDLGSGSWSSNTSPVSTSGAVKSVSVPKGGDAMFFRLRKN